jgi:DNA repair protein RecN (Recombination protein N)
MLTRIHIRDFAIIDKLELELRRGMTVLTGETGAGKSILIDALGLVFGDRATSDDVRANADKADVTLALAVRDHAAVHRWLSEHDLDTGDDECLLRRVVARDGRSRAYINGSPVALQLVRQLGEMLVDIHGQHQHQLLLRPPAQRQVLDAHADIGERLAALAASYRELRTLKKKLQMLCAQGRGHEDRLDLLRFQVRELSGLDLNPNECDELDTEHRRLSHAGRLKEAALAAYIALYEADESTLDARLASIIGDLESLRDMDSELGEPVDLLHEAQAQLREAAIGLRRYSDRVDIDPQRLAWVEARLADIHDLARKHRVDATQLPARLVELQAELASLSSPEFDVEGIRTRLEAVENEYRSLAQAIHELREGAALELSRAVTKAMQALGMSGGRFEIAVESIASGEPTPHGLDHVEFRVRAARSQPIRPLHKIASGGELSRISLALQIIVAQDLSIPTLIFDEVDTGIGGGVAEAVGRQLRELGERRQVLCVTHLPQVAAQAHNHYQVNKRTDDQTARALVVPLEPKARVEEIARMLGGLEMTDKTRAHASEMIGRAQVCTG